MSLDGLVRHRLPGRVFQRHDRLTKIAFEKQDRLIKLRN